MIRRGNWKITRWGGGGAKRANCKDGENGANYEGGWGERGQKIAHGRHCPFCPIAIVRPWPWIILVNNILERYR